MGNTSGFWRTFSVFAVACLLNASLCSSCVKSDSAKTTGSQDSVTPTRKKDTWWNERHESFVENSKNNHESIKILFLGDSITEGFSNIGNKTFQKYYAKYGAANYGISADRTQHLLWRIRNGELNQLRPLIVVLLIGTNNFSHNKDIDIYRGVKAVVLELRRILPSTKILLLGILPRTSVTATQRVYTINKMIMQLDDDLMVWYFDLGRHFFIEDRIVPELYHADLLHISAEGYEMWALAMNPVLREMMEVIFEAE